MNTIKKIECLDTYKKMFISRHDIGGLVEFLEIDDQIKINKKYGLHRFDFLHQSTLYLIIDDIKEILKKGAK